MERQLGLSSLIGAGAVVVLAAQPAGAVATEVTDVRVNQAGGGIEVVLATQSGDRPQIFTVSRGNTLVADIINTRLRLREGNGLLQNSPAPGISSVVVSQLDANSVRVAVTGDGSNAPAGQVRQGRNNIVLGFMSDGSQVAQQPTPAPTAPLQAQAPAPAPTPAPPVAPTPDVLVPNPQVVIDGVPVLQPTPGFVPPLLPRAIAPPVGDIAVSTADPSPEAIDLGTGELVPRLVLREAPVRDVLSLLARAAGLNVAYIGELPGAEAGAIPGGVQPGQQATQDVTISLDIENEPIQNVFNYVLRISGLEANLVGRTVFVGPRLPNDARNLVVRTLRLNQVNVAGALNFLVGLGAETAVSRERPVTFVTAVPTTGGEGIGVAAPITQTQTTTEQRLETQRVEFVDSTPLLRGLQVIGDERTNSVTLIGTPRRIELATSQLAQLDVRRRQVAVNVKVIDVNLLALNRGSTSFSFGVGDTSVVNTGGIGVINFGNLAPATAPLTPGTIGAVVGNNPPGLFDFTNSFLAQLQLAVTNGNAKILTDPTLVVQEGQIAQVQLTQEVVTNFEIETTGTGADRTQTVTVERTPAGLILQVQVDRIDDNGFVSLSVAPSISAPTNVFNANVQGSQITLTLLAERTLTSGQVRVRDGQTLILSGIIQESDRATVNKVPILGDIPLLGALFRNTTRENSRQEVIILLTPQVIDDSDASAFGYRYVPGRQAQQVLQQQGGGRVP